MLTQRSVIQLEPVFYQMALPLHGASMTNSIPATFGTELPDDLLSGGGG